jgi:putative sigma-54 modulation protein
VLKKGGRLMRLVINGRNIEITPALRDYVDEKVGRIQKHNSQVRDIEITLAVVKNPSVQNNHFAEVTSNLNGTMLHVKEQAESMYAAIDLLADKIDRQVKKHKEKIIKGKSKMQGAGRSIRTNPMEGLGVEEEPTPVEEVMEVEYKTEEGE